MNENDILEVRRGIRETSGRDSPPSLYRTYEAVPDLDVFFVNGQSVSRDVFQAKVRELQEQYTNGRGSALFDNHHAPC